MATNDEDPNQLNMFQLKPTMEIALARLLDGASQTDAAQAAGVGRQTVNDWVNHHPKFRAAMAQHRSAAHAVTRTRISNAAEAALDLLIDKVDDGDVNAAKAILRFALADGNRPPAALPATAAEIITADADRIRNREVKRDIEIDIQRLDIRLDSANPEQCEESVTTHIGTVLDRAEQREQHRTPNSNTDHESTDTDTDTGVNGADACNADPTPTNKNTGDTNGNDSAPDATITSSDNARNNNDIPAAVDRNAA